MTLYGFIFHILPAHVHCNISHFFAMTNSADIFAVVEYFANIFFLSKIVILEVPAKCQKHISIHFILAVSNIDQAKWFIIMQLNKFSNFELNFYVVVWNTRCKPFYENFKFQKKLKVLI